MPVKFIFPNDEDGSGGGMPQGGSGENGGEKQELNVTELAKQISELATAVNEIREGLDSFRKTVNGELRDRRHEIRALQEALNNRDGEGDGGGESEAGGKENEGVSNELAERLAQLEVENARLKAERAIEEAAEQYGFSHPKDAARLILALRDELVGEGGAVDKEKLAATLDEVAQKYPQMLRKQSGTGNSGANDDAQDDNGDNGASDVQGLLASILNI